MNSVLTVDEKTCIQCGKCVKECGEHVGIQNNKHVLPDHPRCGKCFHCYTVCPVQAIKPVKPFIEELASGEKLSKISTEALQYFLSYRRSIRSFTDEKVDETVITSLIDHGRFIPSGGNAHSYKFTVVLQGETRNKLLVELTQIYKGRSVLLNNPLVRTLAIPFVDKQTRGFLKSREYGLRMKHLLKRVISGEDPFFYKAPVVVVIHSKDLIPTPKEDCILAGYNINLMAQTMGLGACFVTLAQNAFNASKACKKLIGIDSRDQVYAVLILGYPKVKHLRISPKPEKMIHWVKE